MKTMGSCALAFAMLLGAGCAVDPEDERDPGSAEEVQELRVGCTLLRPLLWHHNGINCIESPNTPLPMADGATYTAHSGGGGIFGHGSVTIQCNDGGLDVLSSSCRPGIEP